MALPPPLLVNILIVTRLSSGFCGSNRSAIPPVGRVGLCDVEEAQTPGGGHGSMPHLSCRIAGRGATCLRGGTVGFPCLPHRRSAGRGVFVVEFAGTCGRDEGIAFSAPCRRPGRLSALPLLHARSSLGARARNGGREPKGRTVRCENMVGRAAGAFWRRLGVGMRHVRHRPLP